MAEAQERALAAASQLEKIGFVDFTVDLVKGVYEVIVKASMDQLKAYADFVTAISKSVAEYQKDIVGNSDEEQGKKADQYIAEVFGLQPADNYTLTPEQAEAVKSNLAGVTVKDGSGNDKAIQDFMTGDPPSVSHADLRKFALQKVKKAAEDSYNLIKTILKLGMQKVVVTNGEIRTKLTFHVDAEDSYGKTKSNTASKASGWGISGGTSFNVGGMFGKLIGGAFGGSLSGGYSSRKLSVSVVNERSSSATNVNVDIIGEVKIQFRTDSFPSIEG